MLYYVTGNQNKIDVAKQFLDPHDIQFTPHSLKLTEIQSHSIEEIAVNKAQQAFKELQKPLFVTDHGWSITVLNGFPGAYMKYMNQWLQAQDFLNLMKNKDNREIIFTEVIGFIDQNGLKTFSGIHKGEILQEIQGKGLPAMTVTSLTQDNISVAKKLETNPSTLNERPLWNNFANWYKNKIT